MARVTIIERSYAENKMYMKKSFISENSINRVIENLESNGFVVRSVILVNYDDVEVERVVITYE